ncbi:alpha/beta hydrolase [Enhygromyxa salina]|uniref:Putative hydrolase n=1 Tax=Enhygromyxa salina TaxID=215803 RepID=A0A2S9YMI4_9BACT|nr:alpha/beta fold hydrolase [Enhygromyxa salina]PRQ06286.1 putative hydrolase [Enhygromyxa salina]
MHWARSRHPISCAILCVLATASLTACEARSPEPTAQHPIKAEPAPPPVAASPASPDADRFQQIAGVHYLEFVTAGADPQATLPMIIAIHGLGDAPEGFRGLLEGFDQPARVIVPRGLDAHGPGWSWFPIRVSEVQGGDMRALAVGIERAADKLAPMIEALVAARPTTGKPIVTGFSQGGMLCFTLAVQHPELLSAALPISGWLPEPLWPTATADAAAIPIFAFHGDADAIVPYPATVTAVAHLEQLGYQVQLQGYPEIGHAISQAMHTDLLEALRASLATSRN